MFEQGIKDILLNFRKNISYYILIILNITYFTIHLHSLLCICFPGY